MDWIEVVQKMLVFMEEHILSDISYDEIAGIVNLSGMYCHQAFRMLVGMTPTEYLRKRRLSLAGQELRSSNVKVIDIALKYGFETPDSFAKAFARFHGITPSQAKQPGTTLIVFDPIKIEFKVHGGQFADYNIVTRSPFDLLVLERDFDIESSNDPENHNIPDFWREGYESGSFDIMKPFRLSDDNYAICSPVSKTSNNFSYGIGVLCQPNIEVPKGFRLRHVEEGMWAVFSCIGEDGECMHRMWDNISNNFSTNPDYEVRPYPDFECYPGKKSIVFSEIWLPVCRRKK